MKYHCLIFALASTSLLVSAAEIHDAAGRGDAAGVAALLKQNAALVREKDKFGGQPLHLAAQQGGVETITALLDAGAEVNAKGFDDWTPLHLAAKAGNKDACRVLLERGADLAALNGVSRTPLQVATGGALFLLRDFMPKVNGADEVFQAIEARDLEKVKALVADNPGVLKGADTVGCTPLLLAAKKELPAIMSVLLEAGADVNAKDRAGRSALSLACEVANAEAVELLFRFKVLPTHPGEFGELLTDISWHGDRSDPAGFASRGREVMADIERATTGSIADRRTLPAALLKERNFMNLKEASAERISSSLRISKLLLDHGASPNATNLPGLTPLKQASLNSKPDALNLLLEHGANPDIESDSWSALAQAVIAARPESIRLLLAAGADPLFSSDHTRRSALEAACILGEPETVKLLLAATRDRTRLARELGPLLSAAQFGRIVIVRILLDQGANVAGTDPQKSGPLHHAVLSDSTEVTLALIAAGVDVNAQDAAGYAPLHNAAESERPAHIPVLLAHGAKLELANAKGETPLIVAARARDSEPLQLLIKAGGRLDARKLNGSGAIHESAASGFFDNVRLLLDAGADVNAKGQGESTPLHSTVMCMPLGSPKNSTATDKIGITFLRADHGDEAGYLAVAKLLLTRKSDVNAKAKFDRTPLHLAAMTAPASMVQLLLDAGADIEARVSTNLETPVISAAVAGNIPALELLMKHGAKLSAKITGGVTILHFAALKNQPGSIAVLLKAGMKVELPDDQGLTPLMAAAWEGAMDAAKSLIEHGANVNAIGPRGITAVQIARVKGHPDIASFLETHGAKD